MLFFFFYLPLLCTQALTACWNKGIPVSQTRCQAVKSIFIMSVAGAEMSAVQRRTVAKLGSLIPPNVFSISKSVLWLLRSNNQLLFVSNFAGDDPCLVHNKTYVKKKKKRK